MLKAFDYEILKAKHKASNRKLLAKVLDKEKTDILDRDDSVKNEILINQQLSDDKFILNMFTTFETKKHLYIMYERYDRKFQGVESLNTNKKK